MRRLARSGAGAAACLLLAAFAASAQPLDVLDPTPRDVLVQVEASADLAVVGQGFGPAFPATYSASGNTGTLVISAATHEAMRAGQWPAVPESFTPIVFEIDLTTLEVTSQPAAGALASDQFALAFTQEALGTTTVGGFIGPTLPPLFCTSQQQLDDLCPIFPPVCDQTCTVVPGSAFDPDTGQANLIGTETQSGCDGTFCDGPFVYFTPRGDLRFSEVPSVPALPRLGGAALLCALAVGVRRMRRPAH